MNEFLALLQLIQAAATLAPQIELAAGKPATPRSEAIARILSSVLDALGRGVEGAAYLQTIGAELQALHDQGKTITEVDLAAVLKDIESVSDEIEAERAKLDAPSDPPMMSVTQEMWDSAQAELAQLRGAVGSEVRDGVQEDAGATAADGEPAATDGATSSAEGAGEAQGEAATEDGKSEPEQPAAP